MRCPGGPHLGFCRRTLRFQRSEVVRSKERRDGSVVLKKVERRGADASDASESDLPL